MRLPSLSSPQWYDKLSSTADNFSGIKIETIKTALRKQPSLKVSILTDALRGTREAPKSCCASLLVPLVEEFGPERVELRMFHTPNLNGLKKMLIPKRLNEGWGLQHMKLYGFDDEVILSGYADRLLYLPNPHH